MTNRTPTVLAPICGVVTVAVVRCGLPGSTRSRITFRLANVGRGGGLGSIVARRGPTAAWISSSVGSPASVSFGSLSLDPSDSSPMAPPGSVGLNLTAVAGRGRTLRSSGGSARSASILWAMRLGTRITLSTAALVSVALGVYGYVSVRIRRVELLGDLERQTESMGRALQAAIEASAERRGRVAAQ